MTKKSAQDHLLDQAMRQAFRADVELPSRAILRDWVKLLVPSLEKKRIVEAEDVLRRIYTDLVHAVRLSATRTRANTAAGEKKQQQKSLEPTKLTTQVAEELKAFSAAIDALIETTDKLSQTSKGAIQETLVAQLSASRISANKRPTFNKLWDQAHEPLTLLAIGAERSEITKKKGRDEAALRRMINSLANVWKEFTGKPPRRSYDGKKAATTSQSGEEGKFLELARAITDCADQTLQKESLRVGSRSLSKIVRTVLEERHR